MKINKDGYAVWTASDLDAVQARLAKIIAVYWPGEDVPPAEQRFLDAVLNAYRDEILATNEAGREAL